MDLHPNLYLSHLEYLRGSVLRPLLFLIYIKDLPMNVKSKVRLFADDTALYLTISTSSQSEILQKDLDNLQRWGHKWDMKFNPSKDQLSHSHNKVQKHNPYTVHSSQLHTGICTSAKYLGVDISSDLYAYKSYF